MDIKKFCLNEFFEYGKHHSSYFNLPANIVVIFAYFLPGILGMINVNLSYFATFGLIIITIFEKKSEMVKFYCLQFCFLSMFFNIILTLLSVAGRFFVFIQLINAILSIITIGIVIFYCIYSLFCALQYKAWIIPWIGTLIQKNVIRGKR